MLFISSRLALTDEDRIGPADEYWDIRIQRAMSTRQTQLENITPIEDAIRGKKVLVLVHGYNNLLDDVIRAYG